MIKKIAEFPIDSNSRKFICHAFEYGKEQKIVLALYIASSQPNSELMLRIQYACLFGTTFKSYDCDCGPQLSTALDLIKEANHGLVLYFVNSEGQGLGLKRKLLLLQKEFEEDISPLIAAERLGWSFSTEEELAVIPKILETLEIDSPICLLTNSPQKEQTLRNAGLNIIRTIALLVNTNELSEVGRRELQEKHALLGHIF